MPSPPRFPGRSEPPPDESVVTEKAAVSAVPGSIPGARRACLLVLSGRDAGRIQPLEGRETLIGRAASAKLRLYDHGISRRHALLVRRGDDWAVQDLGSSNGTMINGDLIEDEIVLRDGDRIQIGPGTIIKFSFHDALDEQFQSNLLTAAQRDGLTGLYNKRYLMDALETEVAYAMRSDKRLGLLMLDVDHFKAINDSLGHLAGDAVLTNLAHLVGTTLRKEDVFARYGGEEFVVICRGETEAGALKLGERLRRLVEGARFEHEQARIAVTISVGVADLGAETKTAEALIKAADSALYAAKNRGRNRCVTQSSLLSEALDRAATIRVPRKR